MGRLLMSAAVVMLLSACAAAPTVSMAPAQPMDYGRMGDVVDPGEVADARGLLDLLRDDPVAAHRPDLLSVADDSLECWSAGPMADDDGRISGAEASACRDDFYSAALTLRGMATPATQSAMR